MRIIRPLEPLSVEEKQRVWDADVEARPRRTSATGLQEGRGVLGVADPTLAGRRRGRRETRRRHKNCPSTNRRDHGKYLVHLTCYLESGGRHGRFEFSRAHGDATVAARLHQDRLGAGGRRLAAGHESEHRPRRPCRRQRRNQDRPHRLRRSRQRRRARSPRDQRPGHAVGDGRRLRRTSRKRPRARSQRGVERRPRRRQAAVRRKLKHRRARPSASSSASTPTKRRSTAASTW